MGKIILFREPNNMFLTKEEEALTKTTTKQYLSFIGVVVLIVGYVALLYHIPLFVTEVLLGN
jgi:hypothetical protein